MGQSFIPIVPYLEGGYFISGTKAEPEAIVLEPHQKRILEYAFTPNAQGELPFRTVVWSTIKKSGKSTVAAGVVSWFAFSGITEPGGEIFIIANDLEGAKKRVYSMFRQSVNKSDSLLKRCMGGQVLLSGMETLENVTVSPISNDYAGEAGANPVLSAWDEIWAGTSENYRRLWDEFTPVLTRRISMRFITTYAGFAGAAQDDILWTLYRSGVKEGRKVWDDLPVWENKEKALLVYWDTGKEARRLPWQQGPRADEYYREQWNSLRRPAYYRLHENRWASNEEGLNLEDWDACVRLAASEGFVVPMEDRSITLAVGIDASYKRDRTSVMTAFKRKGLYCRGPGESWQPDPREPFDLEETVEKYLIDLKTKFKIGPVYYDPYQMVRTATALRKKGFRMVEWPQSNNNHHAQGTFLCDVMRYRRLRLSPSEDSDPGAGRLKLRNQAVATSIEETARGIRLKKDDKNAKIDSIIALAMALVAAETLPDYDSLRDQVMVL